MAGATVVDSKGIDVLLHEAARVADVLDVEHHVAVRTVKEEPRAIVADALSADLVCHECEGPIQGAPVKARLEGRDHYFCCRSCERLFVERYRRLKAAG